MLAFAYMSALSKAQVEAVAALANLELEPQEIELFARQLGDVLTHVEELKQVDTTGVAPTTSTSTSSAGGGGAPQGVERSDEVRPSLAIGDVLSNAPECERAPRDGGFFKVPRIIG
jgi:aspartyl-tRNA(Asn)/glutamyl-tRNA(Gln) amidotransferase subunit C